MKGLKSTFMYKVINIGAIEDAKDIEYKINSMLKEGMKLEFMTDKFMVFVKQEKKHKNESNKP